jgi:hypothetical protein
MEAGVAVSEQHEGVVSCASLGQQACSGDDWCDAQNPEGGASSEQIASESTNIRQKPFIPPFYLTVLKQNVAADRYE